MNRVRRTAVKILISQGYKPKKAYDMTKPSKELFAHAHLVNGMLVKIKKESKSNAE